MISSSSQREIQKTESCDMDIDDNSSTIDHGVETSTNTTQEGNEMVKSQPEAHHNQTTTPNDSSRQKSEINSKSVDFCSPSGLAFHDHQGAIAMSQSAASSSLSCEASTTQVFGIVAVKVELSCSAQEKLQNDDELSALVFTIFKKHKVEYVFENGQFKRIEILKELLPNVEDDLKQAFSQREIQKTESCDRDINDNSSTIDNEVDMSTNTTQEGNEMVKSQPEAHHNQTTPPNDPYLQKIDNNSNSVDRCLPSGLKIHVRQGNLIHQEVESIVNAANVHLRHGGGVARAIADAAGSRLVEECDAYVSRNGPLDVSKPMHTAAGKLPLPILFVIHVAGPRADKYSYQGDLLDALLETFENVLVYANDVLKVSSVAIPAISSGIFGVDKQLVARCCYEAVCKFERRLQSGITKNLLDVWLVNIDEETTKTMITEFQSASAPDWDVSSSEDNEMLNHGEELKSRGANSDTNDNDVSVHRDSAEASVSSSSTISEPGSKTAMTQSEDTELFEVVQSQSSPVPMFPSRKKTSSARSSTHGLQTTI